MDKLTSEELKKIAYESALKSHELSIESQRYYQEAARREIDEANRRALDNAQSDILSFRKEADNFIEKFDQLSETYQALNKQVEYFESKYKIDAFNDDERRLFYTLKMAGVLLKAYYMATKK